MQNERTELRNHIRTLKRIVCLVCCLLGVLVCCLLGVLLPVSLLVYDCMPSMEERGDPTCYLPFAEPSEFYLFESIGEPPIDDND